MRVTLDHLRRYAVARSLFKPTTLGRAVIKLGFVQADPIRSPARAQDLTLRHRVVGYMAGDLERRYATLPIEEDFFVNYGYLPRAHHALLHPRSPRVVWSKTRAARAQSVLEFIHERGAVHPRAVNAHFAHGKITNWFGGSSNATTQLLDDMHYRGLLRVSHRQSGTRLYRVREPGTIVSSAKTDGERFDALIDVVIRKYAPLTAASLGQLVSLLGGGAPQWICDRAAAIARAKLRLASAPVDGVNWYWPTTESPTSARWRPEERVRLLTPFDPVVWDRRRFEIFWSWRYRFEAYTPPAKRKLGYYALPLLWRERVVGWGNFTFRSGVLHSSFGYSNGSAPKSVAFRTALEEEVARMNGFLQCSRVTA